MKKIYAAIPPANPDVQPLMKPLYRFGVRRPGSIFFPVFLIVAVVVFYVTVITSVEAPTVTVGLIVVIVLLHLIVISSLIGLAAFIRRVRTQAVIREDEFAKKETEYVNSLFIPVMEQRYNIQNLTPYEVNSLRQGVGLALLVNGVPMTVIVTENKLGELVLSDAAQVMFEQKELTRYAAAGDGGGDTVYYPAYHIDHGVHNGDGSSDTHGGWSADSSSDGGSDGGGDGGGD